MSGSTWRKLCPTARAAGSVANLTTDVFEARALLRLVIRIAGYSSSSTALVRFNLDTGTTAYAYRISNNGAAASTGVAGAASGLPVSQTATTAARALIEMLVRNVAGDPHGVTIAWCDLSEAAATAPDYVLGAGIWTNTSVITQVTLNDGGSNLLAGTELSVYGLAE